MAGPPRNGWWVCHAAGGAGGGAVADSTSGGRRPHVGWSWPRHGDLALALVLTCWAQLELWVPAARSTSLEAPLAAAVPLSFAMTAPLLARRRAPLPVAVGVAAVFAVQTLLWKAPDHAPHVAALLVAVYSLAALTRLRIAASGLVVVLGLVLTDLGQPGDATFIVLLLAAPWIGGRLVRARQELVQQLRARTAELEQERARSAELAATAERLRIARELHDVLAHHVTAMVVEAEAAGQLLRRAPERSEAWLESIARTGRSTLDEMRRVVAVLRADGAAPGMDLQVRLAEVAGRARGSGVEVALDVAPAAAELPPELAGTVVRVVQEAVTNAVRHAAPCRAAVRLAVEDGRLILSVVDDGRPVPRPRTAGGGHGLVGMRERVSAHGGRLHAGPSAQGFAVRAEIPLAAVPA